MLHAEKTTPYQGGNAGGEETSADHGDGEGEQQPNGCRSFEIADSLLTRSAPGPDITVVASQVQLVRKQTTGGFWGWWSGGGIKEEDKSPRLLVGQLSAVYVPPVYLHSADGSESWLRQTCRNCSYLYGSLCPRQLYPGWANS